ncbi:MAG: hypothetical protein R3E39_09635 [Anaerolineae bacterium]
MRTQITKFVLLLICGLMVAPLLAADFTGQGTTCTTDSSDGSGLPVCGTPDDNECFPGGVLYREENQDGCPTDWYWKAGWYLARFNDGRISREDVPAEFQSALPPVSNKVTTVCKQAVAIDTGYYGCFNANQTGVESYEGSFYDYVVFVNDSDDCPDSFNGYLLNDYDDTQSYIIDYYQFTPAEYAILGTLGSITCYYDDSVRLG